MDTGQQRHNQSARSGRRQRGVALMLALIAIILAATLASSYVGTQTTSIAIARNITHHTTARYVAETGLELALRYVKTVSNWRTEQSQGTWMTDQPFGQGTFTIVGEDGIDTDSDGVVDGDGDLANNATDSLTLTVTGTVNGSTHIVRAHVTPIAESDLPGLAVSETIEVKGGTGHSPGGHILSFGNGTATISTNQSTASNNGGGNGNGNGNGHGNGNGNSKAWITVEENGAIEADISIGPDGHPDAEPGQVISIKDNGQITGNIDVLSAIVQMPTLTEPTNVGNSLGHCTLSSGTTTWNTNRHYNKLTVKKSAVLEIQGDVTVMCDGDVKFQNNAQLRILPNATLTFYAEKKLSFANQVEVNANTADPTKLIIRSRGSGANANIELHDEVQIYATIEAPNGECLLEDESRLYGTFLGRHVTIDDESQFHVACHSPSSSSTYLVAWVSASK